jgi:hypothetical protein
VYIFTYQEQNRTVNDSFPGNVLDTAAPSACRRAVEVGMGSRASRQVDAASRGPDNSGNLPFTLETTRWRFSLFTPSPDYLPSWTRLSPTRSSPTTTSTYPVTLAHHLTIRFRATILIKLHLRLPASTESESERTVRGGSTAGGSITHRVKTLALLDLYKQPARVKNRLSRHQVPQGRVFHSRWAHCRHKSLCRVVSLIRNHLWAIVPCRPPSSVPNGHRHVFQGQPPYLKLAC